MNKLAFATTGLPLIASCASVSAAPTTVPRTDVLARNTTAEGVVTTPSGRQYFIVTSGPKTGRSHMPGECVTFDYEGKLTAGETFDSSFDRSESLTGDIDRFVPGFTEALKLM